jgi:hypothetical protein
MCEKKILAKGKKHTPPQKLNGLYLLSMNDIIII